MKSHYTQFPIQMFVGCLGYTVSVVTGHFFHDAVTTTAISSFVIGCTGNLYGRLTTKLAIVPVVTGVLISVPGGISLRGASAFLGDDTLSGTTFTFQVVQVATAITVGLFVSNLLIFPIKRKVGHHLNL